MIEIAGKYVLEITSSENIVSTKRFWIIMKITDAADLECISWCIRNVRFNQLKKLPETLYSIKKIIMAHVHNDDREQVLKRPKRKFEFFPVKLTIFLYFCLINKWYSTFISVTILKCLKIMFLVSYFWFQVYTVSGRKLKLILCMYRTWNCKEYFVELMVHITRGEFFEGKFCRWRKLPLRT